MGLDLAIANAKGAEQALVISDASLATATSALTDAQSTFSDAKSDNETKAADYNRSIDALILVAQQSKR